MEKIDFHSHYYKSDNLSHQCDFVRPINYISNGKLHSYVGLILFILLLTAAAVREKRKVSSFHINFKSFNYNFLLKPIYCLLSCFILPIFVIILAVFLIVQQVVNIILKLKHGKHFGGILSSADSVWAIEDTSKTVINVLIILKVQTNQTKNVFDQIKKTISRDIFQKPEEFPKLTSVRRRFMGYNFLLKDELSVDDCISSLKITKDKDLDETELQSTISKWSNKPLPKQHTALWEILVSPKPIQWKSKDHQMSSNNYPILLRFSHIAGDGLSFTNLMLKTFANRTALEANIFEKLHINNSAGQSSSTCNDIFWKSIYIIKYVINYTYVILMAPWIIVHQHVLRRNDINSLHGPQLCGEKNLVFATEGKGKLLMLVKDVKKSIPGSKFSDILFSVISHSLEEHFKKNLQSVPKFASAVIPALLSPPNMDEKPVLQNQFSVAILDLPIQMNSNSMLQRIQKMMKCSNEFRSSPQYQVNYWLVTYLCGFIPHPILKLCLKTDQLTMTISNVPGVPKVTIMDEYDIEDIVFFTHHRGKTGVGFSILTYDNRFQLSLTIDKSILASKDEAQMIIDDVFKCIKKLHKEVLEQ